VSDGLDAFRVPETGGGDIRAQCTDPRTRAAWLEPLARATASVSQNVAPLSRRRFVAPEAVRYAGGRTLRMKLRCWPGG
jgi:hypothetical protein